VNSKAWSIASWLMGRKSPRGGLKLWCSGSAAPQNIKVAPRPAAKSMANQTGTEYAGFSSSSPRRRFPYLETKIAMRKTNMSEYPPTYIQPRFSNSQLDIAPYTFRAFSPKARVKVTKATINPAETRKINGSDFKPRKFFFSVFSSDSNGLATESLFDWG